jgi:hypothetical protein
MIYTKFVVRTVCFKLQSQYYFRRHQHCQYNHSLAATGNRFTTSQDEA